MTGRVTVLGLGPGDPALLTAEARDALARATDVFGYAPYVARVPDRPGLARHPSDNRAEVFRAQRALEAAARGAEALVVSGGDPGVFAMAAAVCEAVEAGGPDWRAVELAIVPGITAMLALAARVGAPLGNDFCAISLSDNLKPWGVVEIRLAAAARAGFAIALYNPASAARPWQFSRALEVLRSELAGDVPVVFGRAVRRADEAIRIVPLADARADMADMATCVIVGTAQTRIVARPGRPPLVYTPRAVAAAEAST